MNTTLAACLALAATALLPAPAFAQGATDKPAENRPAVIITNEMELPADAVWKHSFDAYEATAGEVNASLRRALSFAKTMEEYGVEPERVKVAVVVHGPSVFDVASDARYAAKYGDGEDSGTSGLTANPSAGIVAELIARGAEIWVCGYAASVHGVGNADLIEGVKMAPTGTVAHAELQRRGFGLNAY